MTCWVLPVISMFCIFSVCSLLLQLLNYQLVCVHETEFPCPPCRAAQVNPSIQAQCHGLKLPDLQSSNWRLCNLYLKTFVLLKTNSFSFTFFVCNLMFGSNYCNTYSAYLDYRRTDRIRKRHLQRYLKDWIEITVCLESLDDISNLDLWNECCAVFKLSVPFLSFHLI